MRRSLLAPLADFLATWRADPLTIGVLLVASACYLLGMRRLHLRGEQWPRRYAVDFFVLGLGSYAVIQLGFLGVESVYLRWAFTTRIALLIFVVPAGIASGRPIELFERAVSRGAAHRLATVLRWRIVAVFGNAMFATIFMAAVFCLFLTPIAWVLRGTPWLNATLGVVVRTARSFNSGGYFFNAGIILNLSGDQEHLLNPGRNKQTNERKRRHFL